MENRERDGAILKPLVEVARLRVLNRHKQEVIGNFEPDKLVPTFCLLDGTFVFVLKGQATTNEGPVLELAHHLLGKCIPFNLSMTGAVPIAWFARVTPKGDNYEWGRSEEDTSIPSWANQDHLWCLLQINRLLDG